jgi:hypothetical protein
MKNTKEETVWSKSRYGGVGRVSDKYSQQHFHYFEFHLKHANEILFICWCHYENFSWKFFEEKCFSTKKKRLRIAQEFRYTYRN